MSFCLFVSPHDCWWKRPFYPPFTNQPSTVQSAGQSLGPWIPWTNAECSGEADPEEGRVVDVGGLTLKNGIHIGIHWDIIHLYIYIYISISIIYLSWPQDIQIVSNYVIWVDLMTSQRKLWLGLLGIIAKLVKRSHSSRCNDHESRVIIQELEGTTIPRRTTN